MTVRSARCALHADREAAARCIGCERTFCRECVTEYEQAFYCRSCLQSRIARLDKRRTRFLALIGRGVMAAFALLFFYVCFFAGGRYLAHIPPELPIATGRSQGLQR